MLRLATFGTIVVLWTLLFGPPSVLVALVDRSGRWPRRVAGLWGRCIVRSLGLRVVVRGHENLPQGPAMFVANHGSAVDIPIVFGWLPVDFRILHKHSLLYAPIVGQYLWLAGHVPIDRRNAFRARRALDKAAQRMQAGASLFAFPEGTRSKDQSVMVFKRGAFALAHDAGVPVVPVSLANVKELIPAGLGTLRSGTVEILLHPAIDSSPDPAEVAQSARAAVAAGLVRP